MKPVLSRAQRKAYWQKLLKTFPHIPAELAFVNGSTDGPAMTLGSSVLSCVYSLDGEHIYAAGGGRIPGCDTAIRTFNSKSGKEILVCHAHVFGIYALALDPRTGFLASASEDYSVILWNLEEQDAIFLVGGDPIVKGHVAFASEKGWLAIGEIEAYEGFANSVFVIDLNSGAEIFRQQLRNAKEVAALAISTDGTSMIVSVASHQHGPGGTELVCWDPLQGKRVWKKSLKELDVSELYWLYEEDRLAAAIMAEESAGYFSGVALLDARSGKLLAQRLLPGIGACVAVSPDGKTLAVAYAEGGIDLLRASDLSGIKSLIQREAKGHGAGFCTVQFSRDGETILAGNAKGELRPFAVASPGQPTQPNYKKPPSPRAVKPECPRPEAIALLNRIKKHPDDEEARLALARWCDEQGDARGEFVRLDCELARMPAKDRRRKALQKRLDQLRTEHEEQWLGPVAKLAVSWRYHRGLVHLEFKAGPFLVKAMKAWMEGEAAAWVDGLTLYDLSAGKATQVSMLPFLFHLTCLHAGGSLGRAGVKALLASSHLQNLVKLDLGVSNMGEEGARIMAAWPLLSQLTALSLGGTDIGDTGLKALLASERMSRLASLELMANKIHTEGAQALAASPQMSGLRRLDLSNNYLLDEGVIALAKSPYLAKLKQLCLSFTALGSAGASAIAKSQYLKNLDLLDLSANGSLPKTEGAAQLRKKFGARLKI